GPPRPSSASPPATGRRRTLAPSRELPRNGVQQVLGGGGHLVDRSLERGAMAGGRLAETADLADELERGVVDLFGGRDVCAFTKALDASAHPGRLPRARGHEGAGARRLGARPRHLGL